MKSIGREAKEKEIAMEKERERERGKERKREIGRQRDRVRMEKEINERGKKK